MSLRTERTRIKEDQGYLTARNVRSTTPFNYTMTEALQPGCSIVPNADQYVQCNKTWGSQDADANNYLRFGEEFTTYEPGHAVSTQLMQHSFYAGLESSLKLPPHADANDIRGRERIREADVTGFKFPPNTDVSVPRGCSKIYERVVVEPNGPRGGRATRVDVRNASLSFLR